MPALLNLSVLPRLSYRLHDTRILRTDGIQSRRVAYTRPRRMTAPPLFRANRRKLGNGASIVRMHF